MNSETMIFPIRGPPSVVMIEGRAYLKGKALSCTKTKAALVSRLNPLPMIAQT
jgi:hypothetical protein